MRGDVLSARIYTHIYVYIHTDTHSYIYFCVYIYHINTTNSVLMQEKLALILNLFKFNINENFKLALKYLFVLHDTL